MAHLSKAPRPDPVQGTDLTENNNVTAIAFDNTDDPLFFICWRRQSCDGCLKGDAPCSWCPVTSTCVPNPSRLPILAPFGSSQICPLGSKERWELRTLPFGCHVSTITFLTAFVAVFGTLATIGLGFLAVWIGRKVASYWRQGKIGSAYSRWNYSLIDVRRRPLRHLFYRRTVESEAVDEEGDHIHNDHDIRSPETQPLLQ